MSPCSGDVEAGGDAPAMLDNPMTPTGGAAAAASTGGEVVDNALVVRCVLEIVAVIVD